MKVYVVIRDDGMTYENDHHIDLMYRDLKDAERRVKKMSHEKPEYDWEIQVHDLVE
jgi:hypothetical protein